jgi:hypothetical protein
MYALVDRVAVALLCARVAPPVKLGASTTYPSLRMQVSSSHDLSAKHRSLHTGEQLGAHAGGIEQSAVFGRGDP